MQGSDDRTGTIDRNEQDRTANKDPNQGRAVRYKIAFPGSYKIRYPGCSPARRNNGLKLKALSYEPGQLFLLSATKNGLEHDVNMLHLYFNVHNFFLQLLYEA